MARSRRSSVPGGKAASGLALLAGCLILRACFFDATGVAPPPDPYAYRGNFSITSPAASGIVHVESGLHIAWEPGERAWEPLSVYLQGDSGAVLLASGVPDTGRFSVDMRVSQAPPGDRFRVKLVSERDTARWDCSGPFRIVPEPSGWIRFGGLAAGTVAKIESTLTFSVHVPGADGIPYQFSLVKNWVHLETIRPEVADSGTGLLGWYATWNGQAAGDGFRIRAYAESGGREYLGFSPVFSIRSGYAGGYVVRGHSAGDTLHAGALDTVFWEKAGNPGHFSKLAGLYCEGNIVYGLSGGMIVDSNLTYATWNVQPGLPGCSKYRLAVRSLSDAGILSFSDEFTILGAGP